MAASNKPKNADEYVTKKLLETEEALEAANNKIITLSQDLAEFGKDFDKLHKHFKVEKSEANNCLKVVLYKNPDDKYDYGETICFSDSEKFDLLVQLLHLELPEENEEEQ